MNSFQQLKNLWMVWLALLLPSVSMAQFAVSFSGVVTNQGAPVNGHVIYYEIYGLSGSPAIVDSVVTNPNGFYAVGPISVPTQASVLGFVYTFGCNGNFLADTLAFTPTNPSISNVNFSICSTPSACDASFSILPGSSSNQLAFVPNSIGQPGTQYLWSFGDGATSNQIAPFHTYAPGSYTLCLVVTGPGCVDSFCVSITITGGGAGSCNADFNFQANGNTLQVVAQDTSANYIYTWDFGDGTVRTGFAYDQHTYNASGAYNVCLTVLDVTNYCVDSFCQVAWVGAQGNCQAAFSASIDTTGIVSFGSFSQGQGPLTYLWSFGDGASSTLASPVHQYIDRASIRCVSPLRMLWAAPAYTAKSYPFSFLPTIATRISAQPAWEGSPCRLPPTSRRRDLFMNGPSGMAAYKLAPLA